MAIKVQGTTVIDDNQGLRITGISTFTNGPVLVGSATSTGTASQPLQVTGGAYVSGNLGIGTTNPTSLLTVQGGGLFTGIITARNAVTQDSISLNGRAGGTSSFNLSLTPTTLGASRTVTFQDVSGTVYVSGGTDVTLADGGTNASLTAVNGGVVYSTSSAMAITAAGSAGQVLTSNGAASPTWSTLNASPITVCCTSNFLSCNTSATNIDTKSPPSNNFFLGCNAGSSIYTGSSNIFLGPNAGTSNQSGSNNVFLGCNSGCLITGGCNVVIGGFTGTGFVSCTNHIFLSDGAGNNRAQFNGSGAFGLNGANYGTAGQVLTSNGTAGAPTWQAASGGLTLTDDTSTNATRYIPITSATSGSVSTVNVSSTKLQFNPSTGNLSATQFTSLSDVTQKTNIQPIENSIELTKQLQGVRFNWINNNKPSLGLIAQEVEKVLPELVELGDDDLKRVNYSNMIGLLIEAIKEQQVRIEELERKLNA
jgi:hypothetical protein